MALALGVAATVSKADVGPIASYSFDEGSGAVAHDSSGKDREATLHGAEWTEAGKYGGALRFDPANKARLTIPASPELNFTGPFSLEAWVRPEAKGEWDPIFAKTEAENPHFSYVLYADNGEGYPQGTVFDGSKGWATPAAKEALALNTWTHLALVSDGEYIRLFVNGKVLATEKAVTPQGTEAALRIGGNEQWGEYFKGEIDNVRVYARALSEGEVLTKSETPVPEAPGGPIASYSFDEGAGEVAHDSSGNSREATLHGAEWIEAGKYGGALRFDPANKARLTIPASPELNFTGPFSLEAWVRPEAKGEWDPIFAKTEAENPHFSYVLYADNGEGHPQGTVFDGSKGWATPAAKEALALNTWTHLALVSDGEDIRLYVNGKVLATEKAVTPQGTEAPLRIGGNEQWGEYFKGEIDNVRIYMRALSSEEVKAGEEKAVPAPPSATTEAATALTASGATLKASVKPRGFATTYQFEYGTTTSYGTKVPASPESAGSGTTTVAESKAISGLKEATTYHFRISATNEGGTSYGEDKTFTTLKLPIATTEAASGVKEHEATLKASVNPNGAATTYQFEYGTTTSYGTKVPASPESAGSGTKAVAESKAISGLKEGTAYHFRISATSEGGTSYGEDKTFTTLKSPTATTESATGLTVSAATLKASVNPNGSTTTYQFEYGTTTSYGTKIPATAESIGSGTTPVALSKAISGLKEGTIYHFRVTASNQVGTSSGEDRAFTTLKPPTATTESATGLTASAATLKASVNPNGAATTYQFEYGTTTSYGSKVPASPESIGSGTKAVAESKAISGLKEGTIYHYRVVATSEVGTTKGEDKTLTSLKLPIATTEAATGVKEKEATLKASVNPNGAATTYQFEYGTTTSYGSKVPASPESIGSGTTTLTVSKAITGLQEGTTYHYRVIASSAAGTVNGVDKTLTTTHPPQTTIISATPSYTGHEEAPIEFESSQAGSTFKCGFDEGETPTKVCTAPYGLPEHVEKGSHTFVVAAVNSEGQADQTPAKYVFNPEIYPPVPSYDKLISPEEGKQSSHDFTLEAEWHPGVTEVTFQVKLPAWEKFQTIPAKFALNGKGDQVTWPLEVSGKAERERSEPIYFDLVAAATANFWNTEEETVQFRAVFDGDSGVAGASEPVTAQFLYEHGVGAATDAVEAVGPVTLDLLTGQYTMSRTDVSIPVPGSEANLEFTRVYSSRSPAHVATTTLGGGWQPSLPVEQEAEEEAWAELVERHQPYVPPVMESECWNEEGEIVTCGSECPPKWCEEWEAEEAIPESNWVEILDNEGAGLSFENVGGAYIAPEEAKEYVLKKEGETFTLADPVGTHTVFTQNSPGAASYRPTSVSWQATEKSARMVYKWISAIKEYRLINVIAPAAVECPDATAGTSKQPAGCRTLKLEYTEGKQASEDRLSWISYFNGTNPEVKVAEYRYNSKLQLEAEWDPRISPALEETYAYEDVNGVFRTLTGSLKTITPPGQEPWELAYYDETELGEQHKDGGYSCEWAECEMLDRLKSVSRSSLLESPTQATTTIAYQVPVSGEDAPYELGPESVARWGQTDYPVAATAIFPPTEVPEDPYPTDFSDATVHYLDPNGYETNAASPAPPGVKGEAITTAETNLHGDVVRELSAQNRLEALEAKDSIERSHELDSHSEFSDDGTEMLQSWGPLHEVRLESGETVDARQHTEVKYDEGFKLEEGETAPRLPTTETVGADIVGQAEDADVRTTVTEYNWELRRPKAVITDPAGLDLISKTIYNKAGQVVEERQPSDTEGKQAGTTKTVYWTAGSNAEKSKCGLKPAWAGLPCFVQPAAEPSPVEGNPRVPWIWFTKYSALDQLEESYEEINTAVVRKTTTTYDAAGRPLILTRLARAPKSLRSKPPTTKTPAPPKPSISSVKPNAKASTPRKSGPNMTLSLARSSISMPTATNRALNTICSVVRSSSLTERAPT